MPDEREVICVTCPMGCTVKAVVSDGEVEVISGQACKRGIAYTKEEILAPRRMLTTTVVVEHGKSPLVPVRSRTPLSKALLLPASAALRRVVLQAPVTQHQVVLANILDSGVDIIASRDVERLDETE